MNKKSRLRYVLRTLGIALGIIFILVASIDIAFSLEAFKVLNLIGFYVLGVVFLIYGFTGNSSLYRIIIQRKD